MMTEAFLKNLIKDADVLRTRLQLGVINIPEMESFLTRIADYGPQPVKKVNRQALFLQQLENLDKGRSGKPKF